jgi:transcriptional regulator with XRE-family HTH domain
MPDPVGPSRGSQLLKKWRGAKQTKEQAAALLDLDPMTYGRFENGKRKPRAAVGFRIEKLTAGRVPARAWFDPPPAKVRARTKAA